MTREEAIRMIERIKDRINWEVVDSQKKMDALNMAIKALKQEPCEDCISRQAVDELSEALVHTTINKADFVCNFWERLQKLPPVTPKEKSEYEHDRAVVKAYNDGQAFILDKIRAEIEQLKEGQDETK